jgi:thiol-disulfide isomerase/thioredoxin
VKQCLLSSLIILAAACGNRAAEPRLKNFVVSDIAGCKHPLVGDRDRKGVVLLFLGTECPVSNGYAPELSRLAAAFGRKGVLFLGIHADPDVTGEAARKHAAEYRLSFPIALDPRQELARLVGATVMPQAVLLSPTGEVIYRGRIDDRYSTEGKRRDDPRSRDLEKAIEAVLAGKSPPVRETKAFGCPLPELSPKRR